MSLLICALTMAFPPTSFISTMLSCTRLVLLRYREEDTLPVLSAPPVPVGRAAAGADGRQGGSHTVALKVLVIEGPAIEAGAPQAPDSRLRRRRPIVASSSRRSG